MTRLSLLVAVSLTLVGCASGSLPPTPPGASASTQLVNAAAVATLQAQEELLLRKVDKGVADGTITGRKAERISAQLSVVHGAVLLLDTAPTQANFYAAVAALGVANQLVGG